MTADEHDQAVLSRLVGCWEGTLQHRGSADQPFQQLSGTSDNRWVLGGRFVEMSLRAGADGDSWSAVLYVGYERTDRRYVLVSLEPGDRRVTTRRGDWVHDRERLVLTSRQSRTVCDLTIPGELRLELVEESASGEGFARLRAEYRTAAPAPAAPPARLPRRSVIA
jgi:hypothetical protein